MTGPEWEDMADAFTALRLCKDGGFWEGWICGRFPDATLAERMRAVEAAQRAVGGPEAMTASGTVEDILAAARGLREAAA